MTELAKRKADDRALAGLGLSDPNSSRKQEAAAASWDAFRKLAKLRIGDTAYIAGKRVILDQLTPVGGGLIRVRGTSTDGFTNGDYRPSDFSLI
jgi:hypothetical protein